MFSKYQLHNFQEFIAKNKLNSDRIKHTSELVWSYYHFAYYQMISLNESYNSFFKEAPEQNDIIISYLNKSWSYAYGMYALLRTTLEIMSTLRKMLEDTNPIDQYYEIEIKKIIDIANDVVKHPAFKHQIMSSGTQPIALSLNGEIDIVTISDLGTFEKKEINPMKDFETVRNYIEYISEKLLIKK